MKEASYTDVALLWNFFLASSTTQAKTWDCVCERMSVYLLRTTFCAGLNPLHGLFFWVEQVNI